MKWLSRQKVDDRERVNHRLDVLEANILQTLRGVGRAVIAVHDMLSTVTQEIKTMSDQMRDVHSDVSAVRGDMDKMIAILPQIGNGISQLIANHQKMGQAISDQDDDVMRSVHADFGKILNQIDQQMQQLNSAAATSTPVPTTPAGGGTSGDAGGGTPASGSAGTNVTTTDGNHTTATPGDTGPGTPDSGTQTNAPGEPTPTTGSGTATQPSTPSSGDQGSGGASASTTGSTDTTGAAPDGTTSGPDTGTGA